MSCIGRHFFFFLNQSHQGNPFKRVGDVKPADIGMYGAIPRLGRSSEGGHGHSLQCSCLGNPMDGGA